MNATAGDLNGDGITDLAVSYNDMELESVAIYLGNGDGTFTQEGSLGGYDDLGQVIVGDFDRDGKLDVAFPFNIPAVGNIWIFFGNGDVHAVDDAEFFSAASLVTGDFNNDGILDLAAPLFILFPPQGNTLAIFLGNGDGTFKPALPQPPTTVNLPSTTGDFNGDGSLDLAFADSGSSSLKVLLGNGDGTFVEKSGQPASDPSGISIGAVDFNGDGELDLAVVNSADAVTIFLGNGDGTFQTGVTLNTGHSPISIEDFHIPIGFADFNGDGRIDLAVANYDDNTVSVILQAPVGDVSPSMLSFGSQAVGSTSGALRVALSNTGSAPMTVSSAQTSGDFQIQPNNCMNGLKPGSHCDVDVTFAPTAGGTRTGTLTFDDNATNSPQTVSLSGVGTAVEESITILRSSLNASRYGQMITLKAIVIPGGPGTPTGNVTFYDGTSLLASVPLNNSTATLSISTLVAGRHSMTASYGGDGVFGPSTSATLIQTVLKAAAAVTLSSNLNPAYVNELVTFSVIVSGSPTTPTGSVTFKKGTSVLATVPLTDGQAGFTTAFTKAGSFSIVASYSGEQNYLPRNSKAVKQVVKKYATTTALTSNPNPSTHGQPVTFIARVSSAGPLPTGNVVFKNGSTSLGSRGLVNGVAALTPELHGWK